MAQLSLKLTCIAPEAMDIMDAWKMYFPFGGLAFFFRDELLVLGRVTIKIDHSCTSIYYKNLLYKMDPMVLVDEDLFCVVKNCVFSFL